MVANDNNRTNCPVCGMSVRIIRRVDGYTDHYEHTANTLDLGRVLPEEDTKTAKKLRKLRKGKKTVAVVGMAPTSCSLAPYEDEDCEIWLLNEAHAFPWAKRATRWFQIHETKSWKRYIAKRDVLNHAEWLKENPLNIPIYMQYPRHEVPKSVGYPLHEVVSDVFPLFQRGLEDETNFWKRYFYKRKFTTKYFTSTLAYMMGVAILDGFERIEIYGFELSDDEEYVRQKACAEFWIGFAMGRDIEIYTPEGNQIMLSELYGGDQQGAGWNNDDDWIRGLYG